MKRNNKNEAGEKAFKAFIIGLVAVLEAGTIGLNAYSTASVKTN